MHEKLLLKLSFLYVKYYLDYYTDWEVIWREYYLIRDGNIGRDFWIW